jgi:hypothetical protein
MLDSEITTKPVAPASLGGDNYEKSREASSQTQNYSQVPTYLQGLGL